ncbi:hypothetical protein Y032_0043g818 [Ancylostoma ceylanicum]|uniref:Uncharacterized protein n=2 Tax=Ancylostoma ceylanicum TaxID=53326 RepID=A0A016UFI9_9BILA|nr:hypothetical protein Y032_0043g818 [Ancylostoma ceylanicum]
MNWETMKATLYLDDGSSFVGQLFGATKSVVGEIVFQTGMVGYVESLTDPSYAEQLLTLTYPMIGNYGVPSLDHIDALGLPSHFESDRIWPAALIVDRICPEDEHSHWEAMESLSGWLRSAGVPGLAGIDIRMLTKKIREQGTMKAKLIIESDDPSKYEFRDINEQNLVAVVSRKEPETFGSGNLTVVAVDCGMKNNQIRCLVNRGVCVKVVPWDYPFEREAFDGIFLSNGPGDPEKCSILVDRLSALLPKITKPVFGICLGHQVLARAAGAKTYKLKYGNRGHNQPCTHQNTGRCFITSQNHGFAVDASSLPAGWRALFTNENDATNEGIVHTSKPFFSVQFHPEHTAGPTDCEFLFDVFINAVKSVKKGEACCVDKTITASIRYDSTYTVKPQRKVLVLGSGGLTIGQAGEFDYSGAQALKALKEEGIRTVLINPNVATVQTSKGFADFTYFLPITKEYVIDVIKKERPTGILCTFGGQTALNCAIDLYKDGVFEQFNVQVLGTPIQTIMNTEDREKFNEEVTSIGEQVAPSRAATTLQGAIDAAELLGYPVLVRAAFALGGLGSGFANNRAELVAIAQQALAHSDQVLIDKSLKGWKEVEYEVVRDAYDNCVTVCNMENVDPLGIHTGESVVVAPSQTLTDKEYNMLRTCAIKVIRHLGIVGECNIQYALDPSSHTYYIIEVNARLSRSSALASKATGYPLAYVAAKLALGQRLPIIRNSVTGTTTACFEPSLDYCVVKIPRWDLGKFARVSQQIGSSMKSVGEVMGIGRSFEEAFQKALRMVSDHADGFSPDTFPRIPKDEDLENPTDKRMFALARGMYYGDFDVEKAHALTNIDKWFLYRMHNIVEIYHKLEKETLSTLSAQLLLEAKQAGFSDRQIAKKVGSTEYMVRERRLRLNVTPCVKQIDTVAGEWPAQTNYLYVTYNGVENDVEFDMKNAVIVLGSGVYRIGSSVEFDASCVGCVRELKSLGYQTITINCNPETVSTDYDMCDRLYFEEISFETVIDIYHMEKPKGVILAFGGQAPNNIAMSLSKAQVNIFGTSPYDVDSAEDRFKFSRKLEGLQISQPMWKKSDNIEDAKQFCAKVGYPCLIRPSYVLSGAAMNVAHNEDDLAAFLKQATVVAKEHPVVVSKFISEAKEIDVDAVAKDGEVLVMAVSEHVENAGIHSGDATLVTPPQDLNQVTLDRIKEITYQIAGAFNANGPFNMQLIAKDNELKVIECNLRVSRSFPFVSKTLDFDFVALATRAMMAADNPAIGASLKKHALLRGKGRVGVKAPQFSFSRLAGADVMLGVEMASTGEVACFGTNRQEAYLKALLSTGFIVPKKSIFLSIGGYHAKSEMLRSVQTLQALGFELYGSKGTADYFQSNNINVKAVDWPFEEGTYNEKTAAGTRSVAEFFENKEFHLVINLPIRGSGAYRVSAYRTHGYKTRRMAIDNGIPLITDIKCAKLFIEALNTVGRRPPVNSQIDCVTSRNLKRLPGLVDIHVHVREPGAIHKEDWYTCTRAALAGGVTQILAMPNTNPPLIDLDSYQLTDKLAAKQAVVDYALYVGATPQNAHAAADLAPMVAGLKMYLNQTFSTLQMDAVTDWIKHFELFPTSRPIVCHAEKQTLAAVLCVAQMTGRAVHICHVSNAEEIQLVRDAKKKGWPVTCEVCPHHLFLTLDDLPEGLKEVRPRLATAEDRKALWDNIDFIDCFATDHAPHTWAEKSGSEKVPPGFPGVEYMLPLMLTAVSQGKLSFRQLVDRLHYNPKRIFGLPDQEETYIEVDINEEWVIPDAGGQSKCGWTPYAGMKVRGRVEKVVIRGEEAYVDGEIHVRPGFGRNIRTQQASSLQQTAHAGSKNDLLDLDTSLLGELRVVTDEVQQQSGKSISSDESPVPVSLVPVTPREVTLAGRHLLSVHELGKTTINRIFDVADRFRCDIERRHPLTHILEGYVMASMFYEVSTRTASSFSAAMQRLGGAVVHMDSQSSSVQKGETLEDSVTIMSNYADVVVLRHNETGAAARAAAVSPKPVINAGDGAGEHPSQALLDVYTIRHEIGTLNGITIAMVGDLRNGRTVHSLAKLLCVYKDITLHYVSPVPELGMPESVIEYVNKKAGFTQKIFHSLAEGIQNVDVIYVTRIQKERFANEEDYNRVKGSYVLTAKLLNNAARPQEFGGNILGPSRNLPIVLHPLPRVDEISTELDHDDRAAYFRQAKNGMFVRMAILAMVLGKAPL